MYRDHKIGLVIPAHNEERLIRPTLANIPELIDAIYVVDDASRDQTCAVVEEAADSPPKKKGKRGPKAARAGAKS